MLVRSINQQRSDVLWAARHGAWTNSLRRMLEYLPRLLSARLCFPELRQTNRLGLTARAGRVCLCNLYDPESSEDALSAKDLENVSYPMLGSRRDTSLAH